MARKATLIILAWNHWELTEACLESLRECDLGDAEVMVVDNGSTDETPERLTEIDWVRTLRLPKNLGFVRGNNAGIAAADPDSDVVLLNNDMLFPQKDWLARLRACAAAAPTTGIVGCRLVLPNGKLLHAGTFIMPDTVWGQQIGALEKDVGQYAKDREVEGIVFACAFIKREVIEAIGGLALDFESYFEDTDYCLRAREAGFSTVVCGGVTLVHDEHGSTTTEDRARRSLFQRSRRAFRRKWRHKLEAHYERDLLWQSIMNFPSGYAMSCRAFLHALEQERVRTVYRYVYGPGTVFPIRESDTTEEYRLNVIRKRRAPLFPRISVVYGQGDVFRSNRGRTKVGYTMLEVTGFPHEWVRQANMMDEVWVPSEFNREGMLSCGVTRPVHVVPLGVDCDHFHPGATGFPNPMGEYVFLSIFEWGERKEPTLLLRAFNEVFSAREPVRLLCKVINTDPRVDIAGEISRLKLREDGGKINFLLNLEFHHHELPSLYRSADCYVSVSRGEGWNMPLMEAMACGLPSIATDWSAHTEFVNDEIAYPLRVRGLIPAIAKCPYYEGFSWADPDPDHLRFLLREVYDHRDEARLKGRRAAATMAGAWTWRHAARKIIARMEALGA